MKRKILSVCALALLVIPAAMIVTAPPARAYGPTALWQLGFSGNCFNVAACGGVFGFWGWIVLETGNIGDLVVTDYGVASNGQPLDPTTRHFDITAWSTDPTTGHLILNTLVLEKQVGPGPGFQFPPNFDFGIPLAPGHFQSAPLPGVNFEFNVAKVGG